LSEYGEVEGLVEPKSEADVRANAQAVKRARAEYEAEVRADQLEAREILAQAQSLLDEGEVDEHEIADAIREARPELLGHFVENWARWDPEAAQSYWLEAVAEAGAERIERDRRVREQAAWEQQGAIAAAFDERMAKANLTERGMELVKEIVSLAPGSLAGLETPAQAAERADELVRGAFELQRASEEQEVRRGIAANANKTDMALGWSDAEPVPEFDIEDRIRAANVFRSPASRKTVGEMKREMLDDGLAGGMQAFIAKHPTPPPTGRHLE
jgi:hypothetical protein